MKSNRNRFRFNPKFLVIGLLLFFSLSVVAQRNVTTIRIDGETIKKKPIVDSLAEWLSRRDLRKADSCIQIIFNAIHNKDTTNERKGKKELEAILYSVKYEDAAIAFKPGGFFCKLFPKASGCLVVVVPVPATRRLPPMQR